MWAVEKGKIYVGTSPSGEKIEITTSTTKHVPKYDLTITTTSPTNPKPKTIKLSRPFSEWFDASGNFITLPFQQMFASSVSAIGAADPTKALKSSPAVPETDDTVLQYILDQGVAETSGAKASAAVEKEVGATSAGKKSKGRKKA